MVTIQNGQDKSPYSLPVGLLASNSIQIANFVSQQAIQYLLITQAVNSSNKKRKLDSVVSEFDPVASGTEQTKEYYIHIQDPSFPPAHIRISAVDPMIFSMFMRFLYAGSYPSVPDSLPVAGNPSSTLQPQALQCSSTSVRARIFGFSIGAFQFMNYAMNRIYTAVNEGLITITPGLFDYV